MARIKKKGTAGNAKNFVTRSQAVRKLQVSLGDFRRLCIFKGIYPREPRSKKRASKSSTPSTTFYYAKDIQFLLHEPLIAKFRDQKSLAKKISKALGRNEVNEAVRLEKNLTPKVRLDHIIKERYPTFVDALRDLDDALSMLYLFSNLPSTAEVPAQVISKCKRLTMEFEHYLIRTHSLRKSFLSIKGIYYQATVQGQDILWLVPYKFVQRAGGDVDFRIMATFVEFYATLLGFVNFRLYTSIGLVYPPKLDSNSEDHGAELGAFRLEGPSVDDQEEAEAVVDAEANIKAQAEADRLLIGPNADALEAASDARNSDENRVEPASDNQTAAVLDQFDPIDETADALVQPLSTADSSVAARLFSSFTFFLSRETPRHPLEFILKAFGCKRVGWDSVTGEVGSYCAIDDPRITHQIVDRPNLPLPSPPTTDDGEEVVTNSNERVPGRVYVQPQWIWDSINAGQLQRPDLYAPGATLPPHLSPWVKPKKGEYDPTLSLAEQETAAEAEAAEEDDSEDENEEETEPQDAPVDDQTVFTGSRKDVVTAVEEVPSDEEDGGMTVELGASDEEEEEEDIEEIEDNFDGFSGDEEEIDGPGQDAQKHQAELEAEAQGKRINAGDSQAEKKKKLKQVAQAKRTKAEKEAEEDIERRRMMMPRRKRKMYDKMVFSNAKKDEEAEKLRAKRRKIEKELSKQKR